jgi:hypothetical protein
LDAFGYVGSPTLSPALILSGQSGVFTLITSADDASIAVPLGSHSFRFYGQNYTGNASLFVSSNGLISFGAPNNVATNTPLADGLANPIMAVLWDDWVSGGVSPLVRGLFRDSDGNASIDQLVLEWNQGTGFQIYVSGAERVNAPPAESLQEPSLPF